MSTVETNSAEVQNEYREEGFRWSQFRPAPLPADLQVRFRRHFRQDALEHTILAVVLGLITSLVIYLTVGILGADGGWFEGPQLGRAIRFVIVTLVLVIVLANWQWFRRYWTILAWIVLLIGYALGPLSVTIFGSTSSIVYGWPAIVSQVLVIFLTFPFIRLPLAAITVIAVLSNAYSIYALFSIDPIQGALAGSLLAMATVCGMMAWYNNYRRERQLFDQVLRLEEAADQAQQARLDVLNLAANQSRLRRAIAHDIRQPMAAVAIQMSMIENGATSPDKGLKSLSAALDSLTMQVDEIANSDATGDIADSAYLVGEEPTTEVRNVAHVIDMATTLHIPLAVQSGVSMRSWISPRAKEAMAQTAPGILTTVMQSLLSNAIKAVKETEKKNIFVGVNVVQERIQVRVLDTGVGIVPGDIPDVFSEGFSRFSETPDRLPASQGLGLYNASRLLKKLDGHHLAVRSERDKYTIFELSIPVHSFGDHSFQPNPIPGQGIAAEGDFPFDNRNVLLVEDNDALLRSLRQLFHSWGATVTAVSSSKEAMNIVKEKDFAFDVLVSDFNLGEYYHGLQLAKEVRAHYDGLIATAVITGEDVRFPQDLDIPVLYKPFSPTYLKTLLIEQMEQVAARLN